MSTVDSPAVRPHPSLNQTQLLLGHFQLLLAPIEEGVRRRLNAWMICTTN